jgi:TonB C terminal
MPVRLKSRLLRRETPSERSNALTLGGLVASVLIHLLLMTPLVWGGHRAHQRLPDSQGVSAGPHQDDSLKSMLVVFEEDPAAIHDTSQNEDPSDPIILPKPSLQRIARVILPTLDASVLDETDQQSLSEANGDQVGRSVLFGRYMGQISARVERAWIRPRISPGNSYFACRVNITQDRHGNVQEVILEKCSDQPQWQVSLVRAIQAASPLPAPPDPTVFSNLVTMEFDSVAYVAGAAGEGFEPLAVDLEIGQVRSTSRRLRPDGSVDLTITGSRDSNRLPTQSIAPLVGGSEMMRPQDWQ